MKIRKLDKLKLIALLMLVTLLASCGVTTETTSDIAQPTATEASRILTQGTFGVSIEDINRLQTIGSGAWFNDQFSLPQTMHFDYVNQALSALPANSNIDDTTFLQSFWKQAITGKDQLRQRVTFALSEIFVISFQNATLASMPRSVASYYDMLGAHAFGNFRDLLQDVTLHPAMGIYLSSLGNQKTAGAREPDQNYAREVMQLFTIGLNQLNIDGSNKLDGSGKPIPTYTNDDIAGTAKIFTGWSWAGPDKTNGRFLGNNSPKPDPNKDRLPMQNYVQYHELTQYSTDPHDPLEIPKSILYSDTDPTHHVASASDGLIPENTSGEDSLKIALDTLFNHPNVGPFIGRQLIQRLVTDNPSPEYIKRVAQAFNDNGNGVRGDMKAVIKAVLLDSEAVDPTNTTKNPSYNANTAGKLREPVIRMANWMRAFHVSSTSGNFKLANTDNPVSSLGQTAMNSPSVFNFYRPDYQAPNTTFGASMVEPEMQITDETSVFGYLNILRAAVGNGIGSSNDIKADYSVEIQLAATPDLLLDRISLLLLQNKMSTDLRTNILAAINSNKNNSGSNIVKLAIFLTMASPEYITQK